MRVNEPVFPCLIYGGKRQRDEWDPHPSPPFSFLGFMSSTSHLVNSVSQFHCLPLSVKRSPILPLFLGAIFPIFEFIELGFHYSGTKESIWNPSFSLSLLTHSAFPIWPYEIPSPSPRKQGFPIAFQSPVGFPIAFPAPDWTVRNEERKAETSTLRYWTWRKDLTSKNDPDPYTIFLLRESQWWMKEGRNPPLSEHMKSILLSRSKLADLLFLFIYGKGIPKREWTVRLNSRRKILDPELRNLFLYYLSYFTVHFLLELLLIPEPLQCLESKFLAAQSHLIHPLLWKNQFRDRKAESSNYKGD